MFESKQAAEFLVVGWCKDWTIGQYMRAIGALTDADVDDWEELVDRTVKSYPWMPTVGRQYKNTVRSFIGAAYPKLSAWLFSRPTDIDRLKCAAQIERLKCPSILSKVSDSDRSEMVKAGRNEKQASASYKLSRASFKTHGRSAWNVCKA